MFVQARSSEDACQHPAAAIVPLQERYPFYVWDEAEHVVRWMCSWDTREADVDAFAGSVRELAQL